MGGLHVTYASKTARYILSMRQKGLANGGCGPGCGVRMCDTRVYYGRASSQELIERLAQLQERRLRLRMPALVRVHE